MFEFAAKFLMEFFQITKDNLGRAMRSGRQVKRFVAPGAQIKARFFDAAGFQPVAEFMGHFAGAIIERTALAQVSHIIGPHHSLFIVRGLLGRGGTYRIAGPNGDEAATGFSLFPDGLIDLLAAAEPVEPCVFLPLGHDPQTAARLRSIGWRTVAALSDQDSAQALGCSHVLTGDVAEPV